MTSMPASDPDQNPGSAEVNRQVFNLEQVYLLIGDQYEQLRSSHNLALLDPSASLDQDTVLRLALVAAFQFAETLPDADAAVATLHRRDWKYALNLPMKHPGFSASRLCRFREGLYASAAALQEFDLLMTGLGRLGLYAKEVLEEARPEEALRTICRVTRFYQLRLAMKSLLSFLAADYPAWLRENAQAHWYSRYNNTGMLPKQAYFSRNELQSAAQGLGSDFHYLFNRLREQNQAEVLAQFEVQQAERLFLEEFQLMDAELHWKTPNCASCICHAQRSGGGFLSV